MARAQSTDFISNFRFHVNAVGIGGLTWLQGGRAGAGFTNCSTPEATNEAVEYREGNFVYTRKYPGLPTISDVTLSRGVARADSSFWDWMRVVIEGSAEYRADVQILHFAREQALTREFPAQTGPGRNLTEFNLTTAVPARIYHLAQAFPIRHKVAGDLDGTASEISIMELDLAFENFEVEPIAP